MQQLYDLADTMVGPSFFEQYGSQLQGNRHKTPRFSPYEPDAVSSWLNETLTLDQASTIPKISLYRAYQQWCQSHKLRTMTSNIFGKFLFLIYPSVKSCRPGQAGRQVTHYRGLAWRNNNNNNGTTGVSRSSSTFCRTDASAATATEEPSNELNSCPTNSLLTSNARVQSDVIFRASPIPLPVSSPSSSPRRTSKKNVDKRPKMLTSHPSSALSKQPYVFSPFSCNPSPGKPTTTTTTTTQTTHTNLTAFSIPLYAPRQHPQHAQPPQPQQQGQRPSSPLQLHPSPSLLAFTSHGLSVQISTPHTSHFTSHETMQRILQVDTQQQPQQQPTLVRPLVRPPPQSGPIPKIAELKEPLSSTTKEVEQPRKQQKAPPSPPQQYQHEQQHHPHHRSHRMMEAEEKEGCLIDMEAEGYGFVQRKRHNSIAIERLSAQDSDGLEDEFNSIGTLLCDCHAALAAHCKDVTEIDSERFSQQYKCVPRMTLVTALWLYGEYLKQREMDKAQMHFLTCLRSLMNPENTDYDVLMGSHILGETSDLWFTPECSNSIHGHLLTMAEVANPRSWMTEIKAYRACAKFYLVCTALDK